MASSPGLGEASYVLERQLWQSGGDPLEVGVERPEVVADTRRGDGDRQLGQGQGWRPRASGRDSIKRSSRSRVVLSSIAKGRACAC